MKSIFSAPGRALTSLRTHLDDVIVVSGWCLLSYGLALVYLPLGPIALGVGMIGLVRLGSS